MGATIVKEKFISQPADGTLVLAALGIMIKRGVGFDVDQTWRTPPGA